MLNFFEKILFEKFPEMPAFVRVLTYLIMLVLFVYLLLVPKFTDGHLSIKDPTTGRSIDYRGAELRMNVEGRTYKFTANEDGYWSIPIVSKLPEGIEFEVHDVDNDMWHPVKLSLLQVWQKGPHKLEITNNPPSIKIVSSVDTSKLAPWISYALSQWLPIKATQALAGEVQLPPNAMALSLTSAEKARIRSSVIDVVSKITGKRPNEIRSDYSLTGDKAPTYVQRIQIIEALEKEFNLMIPDEHWKSLETIGQLIDYVEKRQIILKSKQGLPKDWQGIQQSFPPEERPKFKR
jgi:acyl carrier protein